MVGDAVARPQLEVDAVAERQKPQALDPARLAVEVAHSLGKPAQRPGRESAEDDPSLPCLMQDAVDPVRPPDPEQADYAAAADVDQILGEEVAAQIDRALLAAEEGDVAGLAALSREGTVETDDVVVGIAAGRGQKADARALGPGEAEHVVVEQRVARLHREPATAERHDLAECCLHCQMVARGGRKFVVQRSEVRAPALARMYIGTGGDPQGHRSPTGVSPTRPTTVVASPTRSRARHPEGLDVRPGRRSADSPPSHLPGPPRIHPRGRESWGPGGLTCRAQTAPTQSLRCQPLTKALTARVLATATAPSPTSSSPAISGSPSSAAVPHRSLR